MTFEHDNKVNLSQLMGLDRMERWLGGLVHKMDQHEAAIQRLTAVAGGIAKLDSVATVVASLQAEMQSLSKRVDGIERSMVVQHEGASCSVSTAVEKMLCDVVSVSSRLGDTVTKDMLAETSTVFMSRCDAIENRGSEQFATRELANRLLALQDETMQRLTATEATTATKADKSQLARIEAAAAQLEQYTAFKSNTDSLVQKLQQQTENLLQSVSDQNVRITNILAVADGLQSAVAESANRGEMEAARSQIQHLQQEVAACTKSADAQEMLSGYPQLRSELAILQQAVEDNAVSHDTRIGIIETQAPGWVTSDQLSNTLRQTTAGLEGRINQVLHLAARKTDVQQIAVACEALRDELEKTDGKAALAVRFVDWFTERGDAYEHNLQAVDRHLSKLSESATSVRRPEPPGFGFRY